MLSELVCLCCVLSLWCNVVCVNQCQNLQFSLKRARLASARHAGTHKPLSARAVCSGEVIWVLGDRPTRLGEGDSPKRESVGVSSALVA